MLMTSKFILEKWTVFAWFLTHTQKKKKKKKKKSIFKFGINKLDIDIMVRVFTNDLGDLCSIPDQVIPKTQKNGTWCLLA